MMLLQRCAVRARKVREGLELSLFFWVDDNRPNEAHLKKPKTARRTCGLGVMGHVMGRCGTHTYRKWVFRMVVGG